jgi:hypothetical protein
VVSTRIINYNVTFSFNGEDHHLATEYECHYEDVSWISSRGAEWHIRDNSSRIVAIQARMANGATFWISTLGLETAAVREDRLCPESTVSVRSYVTVNRPSLTGGWQAPEGVRIVKSELVLLSSGLGLYRGKE